ncbi:hypothetical protein TKWG_00160 [Advenella kashmirensis WT001]|uniref:Uncharacterized protein n=1 Tax=Advenella kashmirensis (strain DSM 17095 / LMG 22695 / WT001) TaxID=1036672 RepID=I3U6X2_ADVKW|nr:hypothetical protein [Advenella kashmirensis]AFK60760.1 hypothetical protein TKWG_00160 [Advenella kashmirensis WT001]
MNPSDTDSSYQTIDLSKLRDIGWTLWDPISLLGTAESKQQWYSDRNLPFADEYDAYLVSAANALRNGAPAQQVVDYLVHIETQHMCLTERPDTRSRAKAVVTAILADDSIWFDSGGSPG